MSKGSFSLTFLIRVFDLECGLFPDAFCGVTDADQAAEQIL